MVTHLRKVVKIKPIDWKHEKVFGNERYSAKLPFGCWINMYPITPTEEGYRWRWVLKQRAQTIGEGYAYRDDDARERATKCWINYVHQALVVEYLSADVKEGSDEQENN